MSPENNPGSGSNPSESGTSPAAPSLPAGARPGKSSLWTWVLVAAALVLVAYPFLRRSGTSGSDPAVPVSTADPVAAAEAEAKTRPTPESFINLSLVYFRAGNYDGCVSAAQEALKLRPNYALAYNNIGAGYLALKRWDEAIAATEQSLRLDPGSQLAKNNMAAAQSGKQKALADAEAEAKAHPTPESYINLSLVYYRTGNFEACANAAKEALKLRPNYASAYLNIGVAYAAMKRWDDAIAASQEAVRLDPSSQLAKNNLAWAQTGKKQGSAAPK